MFGSRSRPGMSTTSSLGDGAGMFGSHRRPGMGLGSLSGSTLGDANTPAEPVPVTTMTAPAPAPKVTMELTLTKGVKVAGLLALAYYIYRKASK